MPHQTTDRDFPQEESHARIILDEIGPVYKERILAIVEIARMINREYKQPAPNSNVRPR